MRTYFLLIFSLLSAAGASAQSDPAPTPSPTPQPIRETVIVSADLPQPIDEVSKTVNIITGQEMRERADFSLVETLRSMPGFRVQQLGGFGRTANIKTRGLRNQDTALLIDGFRLRDTAAITGDASPFLSDITLTSVSRIEVLRGSGSSLYGTNSIGATVNFITPDPQPGTSGQVSYAAGGLGLQRFRGNISHGLKSGRFGFNLAGSRTVYTKGIDGNDDARNTNFQSRIEARPGDRTSLSARFFISDAFVKLNSNPDTLGTMPGSNSVIINAAANVNFRPDVDDPDNSQGSQFFNGQFTMSHTFTNELSLNAGYSGLRTERKNINGPLGVGFQSASTSIFKGTINTANASLNWTPGRHNLRVGYEYEREGYGNDGFTPSGSGNFFTRAGQSSSTLFVQELFGAFDGRLQLAGGLRAQFFDLDQPTFSLTNAPYTGLTVNDPPSAFTFDGAVSYFFSTSGTKLRAHAGNGYRVPSLYERYGSFFSTFPSANFVALGDPRLKPEKSIAFDAGIEQYAAGERIKLTGTYFYTKLIDTIGFGNVVPNIGTTPRPFGGYENQKGGTAKGAEFSASFRPTGSTDIFASYTLTKSRQRAPQVSGSGILRTLGIPEHQFTMVATQRFGRAWVNFDLLVASSYLAPIFSNSTFTTYVYRFEGNRRGDLTGGYTFRLKKDRYGLRLFGTIENVFDNEYYENGFRTAGVNGRVGVAFNF
jgi:iron complex outermembrane receptor protein